MRVFTAFDYAVFSQRLGASRRLAWRSWKQYEPGASWPLFVKAWEAARAAEELRAVMPGLGKPS